MAGILCDGCGECQEEHRVARVIMLVRIFFDITCSATYNPQVFQTLSNDLENPSLAP
jgi:hypothetical protein